jgi:hypothetical protein
MGCHSARTVCSIEAEYRTRGRCALQQGADFAAWVNIDAALCVEGRVHIDPLLLFSRRAPTANFNAPKKSARLKVPSLQVELLPTP